MRALSLNELEAITGGISHQTLTLGICVTMLIGMGVLAALVAPQDDQNRTMLPIFIGPFFDIVNL